MATTPFERICAAIKDRNLSEGAASQAAGLDRSALANARRKNGRLDLGTLEKFAAWLEVPVSTLLGEPGSPGAAGDGGRAAAAHDRIHPSPLNPRKRFDPEAIEDLAGSVAVEGVLQELLVRRANQPGNTPLPLAMLESGDNYEIIAGERRWRAAERVIALGLQSADWPLPIRLIHPCSDRKMLELALTENVARRDMTALEEAEAFAQLIAEGATTEDVAKTVGMNIRTVQKRLRLARDLGPEAKSAMAEGRLKTEFANILAELVPLDRQPEVLRDILDERFDNKAHLRESLIDDMVEVGKAFFADLDQGGPIVETEEGRFFTNAKMFAEAQYLAIKIKFEELADRFAWVSITGRHQAEHFYGWKYDQANPGHPKAGAVIDIGWDSSVTVHENLVLKQEHSREKHGVVAASRTTAEQPPFTEAHRFHARRRKTQVLQNRVAHDTMLAMRLTCLALLGATDAVRIKGEGHETYDDVVAGGARSIIESFLPQVDPAATKGFIVDRQGAHPKDWGKLDQAKLWQILAGMQAVEIQALFAGLVALRVGSFNSFMTDVGDREVVVAIADTLDITGDEDRFGLSLMAEDLKGIRKEMLCRLARNAGISGFANSDRAADIERALMEGRPTHYVLPTLRFGTAQDIRAATQVWQGEPDESDSSPPATDGIPDEYDDGADLIAAPTSMEEVEVFLAAAIAAAKGRACAISGTADRWVEEIGLNPAPLIADAFGLTVPGDEVTTLAGGTFGQAVDWVCAQLDIPTEDAPPHPRLSRQDRSVTP